MGDLVGKKVGNYEILDILGQGSMGVVFKAKQVSMDRLVALKVLPSKLAQDASYVQRFITEARAAGQITHPSIVAVHDVVKFSDTYAFSMDFIDGSSAQEILDQQGAFPESEALLIAKQIAGALAAAHAKKIIHRDVKPDNIMIDAEGTAKLSDLGLARIDRSGEARLTVPGTAIGTPHYMAPEEARAETVDNRADIYSLGASLFHMVTGRTPFDGPSAASVMVKHATEKTPDVRDINPEISVATSKLIRKMMSKEPRSRPSNAQEITKLIEKIEGGAKAGDTARRPRIGETRRRMRTGSAEATAAAGPLPIIIGVVAALLVVIVVLVAFSGGGDEKPVRKRPAKVVDDGTAKAEELARAARAAYRAVDDWAEAHADDLQGQLERFEKFIDAYPVSADAEIAREKVEGLKGLIAQKRAEEEVDLLLARAKAKAEAGNYGEAAQMLAERVRGDDPLSSKLKAAAEDILVAARAKYRELKGAADELAAQGHFDRAKDRLRPVIRSFGIDELRAEAEAVCKGYDVRAASAADAAEKKTFDEVAGKARKLAVVRRYSEARDEMLGLALKLRSEKLKKEANVLAEDFNRAHRAYSTARTRLAGGSRTKLVRVGLGSRGYALDLTEAGVKVERAKATTVIQWASVAPASYAKLVMQNITGTEGTDYLNVGVLAVFAEAWAEAKEMFAKTVSLDPTLQSEVERYMRTVEPKLAAIDERAAAELFEAAKLNAAKRLTIRVAALVKQLQQKYGHTQFVKTHAEEIAALLGGKVPGETGEEVKGDPVAALKKFGWETVEGNWKIQKKDYFLGEGTIKLETADDWKNAAVRVDAQLEKGDELHILVRYDESRQNQANNLRGGFGRRGRRGGNAGALGSQYDVPQGYGIIVEKDEIRIIDGGASPFGPWMAGLEGLSREVKSINIDGRKGHNYTVTIEGDRLAVLIDNRQVHAASSKKFDRGSVRIYGKDVEVIIRKPQVKKM